MGALSIWHILLIGGAALLLFGGKGKISDFMGDFGKGIKSFKSGLNTSDEDIARKDTIQRDPVAPTVIASADPIAPAV
jgi:sec-independent protein translocase protein TatA